MSKREQLATFFFSATMIGLSSYIGGAVGGAIGIGIGGAVGKQLSGQLGEMAQELIKGVGEDELKDIIRGVWQQSLERGSADEQINHDLSKALARAFEAAIDQLEGLWWRHPCGQDVIAKARGRFVSRQREGKQTYKAMRSCFQELKADAANFCTESNAAFFFSSETRAQLAQAQAAISQDGFMTLFDPYFQELPVMIFDYRKVFIQFIKEHLMIHVDIHLREQLKRDTKAWRALRLLRDEKQEATLDRIESQGDEHKKMLNKILQAVAADRSLLSRQPLETKLHHAFLKLNYREQIRCFRRVNRQHASAFLIHGPPMFGQRWLLNRLVAKVLEDGGNSPFRFHLGRRGRRINIEALWAEIHSQMGLDGELSARGAIKKVYRLWQTQTVVLIFHDIDLMSEAYLKEFIRDFWVPLRRCRPPAASFRLLMFLVDYSGEVNRWSLPFDEPATVTNRPHLVVKLPVLAAFDESLLSDWAVDHDFLPLADRHQALQIIHEGENGTPELVMQYICDKIFCCSWSSGVEKCLAY